MTKTDIPQVSAIDREAFPTMWPPVNFASELNNRLAHYVVACDGFQKLEIQTPPPIRLVPVRSFLGFKWPFNKPQPAADEPMEFITGFVGMWMMVDEVHIINIAVRASQRSKGIGEMLLIASIDMATKLHASLVTLEVRASNTVAQNLYSKYGFQQMGIRKGYYTDNKEDAWIMTTDIITTELFQASFQNLKEKHLKELSNCEYMAGGKWF
jgi:[ribosomal protein S18]-alanine N-acetyltransferase